MLVLSNAMSSANQRCPKLFNRILVLFSVAQCYPMQYQCYPALSSAIQGDISAIQRCLVLSNAVLVLSSVV